MFHPINSVEGLMIHQFTLIAKNENRALYFDEDTLKTYETRNMNLNLQERIGVPFFYDEADENFKEISKIA